MHLSPRAARIALGVVIALGVLAVGEVQEGVDPQRIRDPVQHHPPQPHVDVASERRVEDAEGVAFRAFRHFLELRLLRIEHSTMT